MILDSPIERLDCLPGVQAVGLGGYVKESRDSNMDVGHGRYTAHHNDLRLPVPNFIAAFL